MARKARVYAVVEEVVAILNANPKAVYAYAELAKLLEENRAEWRLPPSFRTGAFLAFLTEHGMRAIELKSPYSNATRYLWRDPSPYAIALSLRGGTYLSHGTAAWFHGLSEQVPKIIYVNKEQSAKPRPTGGLTQDSLDRAFSHQQRLSKYVFHYDIFQIVLLSGMQTGDLEVTTAERFLEADRKELLRVTKMERTLIDIAVRPSYAGGVTEVLEAYRRAKDKISIPTLVATLKKLAYIYPYHQAVGFYMERAGYEAEKLDRLRSLGLNLDFYLTYGLKNLKYDPNWRLRYPEGL